MSSSFAISLLAREFDKKKSLSQRFSHRTRRKVNPTCKEGAREDFQLKVKRFFMIIKYFFSPRFFVRLVARLFIAEGQEFALRSSSRSRLFHSSKPSPRPGQQRQKSKTSNRKIALARAAQLNSNQVKMF